MKPHVVRMLIVVSAIAAVAAAAVVVIAASTLPAATADAPSPTAGTAAAGPPYSSALIVKSEIRLKADLILRNLKGSPQLVFFGGSRSQRFDPVVARRLTGLRAVNIAHSNARPEAAWGYLNWFYHRSPQAKIRWIWGVQAGMLRDRDLDPALLQDSRFYPYFPDDLLAAQRKLLPQSVAQMPKSYGFLRNRYSSLGLLRWNTYDLRRSRGYTLDRSLDAYIAKMLHTGRSSSAPSTESLGNTRARKYFEQTIKLLNDHGTTPVIVLMPIHPRVLRVMEEHGMGGERQRVRDYLAELGKTLSIKVLDFTDISSFHGNPSWFYDGVHITRSNSNRVIMAVKAKAGKYLK